MARKKSHDDEVLSFPAEDEARERALSLFGIDIESSLRGWFEEMGFSPERVEELSSTKANGNGLGHGRAHAHTRELDDLRLTTRQREVLAYIAAGYTRREAGEFLGISEETAKRHLDRARFRFRATNLPHLIVLAALVGEIDTEILSMHLFREWQS